MSGPLHGFKVIDLTSMISGPLAGMILADQGADVIKVEPAGGDSTRGLWTRHQGLSASFLNNNRNKRSIVLDLKHADGKAALLRLIEGADVVLQNFRPGVVDRLGIGYEHAKAVNPKIIYMSITGFGETGPYAHKPVFDPLVQSLTGLTTVQAGSDERRPALVRTILPDKLTAFTASQSITAALLARERTGEGQHVHLSMLDTVVSFLWSSDMGGHTFVGNELETETAQSFIDLIYETADGYLSCAAFRRVDWEKLSDALEQPHWKDDERFLDSSGLEKFKEDRLKMTQDVLKTRTTAEWIARLEEHDVPCAPVLTRTQMRQHPQIEANGIVEINTHPVAGDLRQTRHAARFDGTPPQHQRGAPLLAEHTREVLTENGFAEDEIKALLSSGAATQGVTG
ncbi:MAG: CoA transferase [Pseudomonadota bacterium]